MEREKISQGVLVQFVVIIKSSLSFLFMTVIIVRYSD